VAEQRHERVRQLVGGGVVPGGEDEVGVVEQFLLGELVALVADGDQRAEQVVGRLGEPVGTRRTDRAPFGLTGGFDGTYCLGNSRPSEREVWCCASPAPSSFAR
jgi:hypothetical protein